VNSFPACCQAVSIEKLETEHHDLGSITEKPCPFSARLLVRKYRSAAERKLAPRTTQIIWQRLSHSDQPRQGEPMSPVCIPVIAMEGFQSLSASMVRVKAFLVIKYKVFSNLNGKYFSSFEAHKTAESWPVTTSPHAPFHRLEAVLRAAVLWCNWPACSSSTAAPSPAWRRAEYRSGSEH
jgi:hypothetical protein